MALYKRKNLYWIDVCHNGERVRRSTGTNDKIAALELHDKIKADLWRQAKLSETPQYVWAEAALRWIKEAKHKRSLRSDIVHLRWLDRHLKHTLLLDIDRNEIDHLVRLREEGGASNATINRMLALMRSILNKAADEWDWLDKVPRIKLRQEDNRRVRWLTQEQVRLLLLELPEHSADMVVFTLATGLRQGNVKRLKWTEIDLQSEHAWVNSDEAKANKAIPVPLNRTAMQILLKRKGRHPIYVFTYKGKPVEQVNTKAWKKALKRAGIQNFRWHDLRHTWASWHVQNGTSLQELQQLGGWASFSMVLRYAHLSSEHLKHAANRVHVTNATHCIGIEQSEKSEFGL